MFLLVYSFFYSFFGKKHYSYSDYLAYDERPHLYVVRSYPQVTNALITLIPFNQTTYLSQRELS